MEVVEIGISTPMEAWVVIFVSFTTTLINVEYKRNVV